VQAGGEQAEQLAEHAEVCAGGVDFVEDAVRVSWLRGPPTGEPGKRMDSSNIDRSSATMLSQIPRPRRY